MMKKKPTKSCIPASIHNNKTQNQKQVSGGKILFGKDDSHEKYVVESIKKRPVKFQEEAPPIKQEPVSR